MRRIVYALMAGILTVVMAAPVFAQTQAEGANRMASSGAVTTGNTTIEAGGASSADLNMERYKAWDEFRASNPRIASELKHNPKLAGSSAFLDRNPQLKELFQANAGMQEDMQRNPGNYLAGARYSAHHRNHRHHTENKG